MDGAPIDLAQERKRLALAKAQVKMARAPELADVVSSTIDSLVNVLAYANAMQMEIMALAALVEIQGRQLAELSRK